MPTLRGLGSSMQTVRSRLLTLLLAALSSGSTSSGVAQLESAWVRAGERHMLLCRPLASVRGGMDTDSRGGDSDTFLEFYAQPQVKRREKSTDPTCYESGAVRTSPAKSPTSAQIAGLGKRQHRPTDQWLDYPEDGSGGHEYQGERCARGMPAPRSFVILRHPYDIPLMQSRRWACLQWEIGRTAPYTPSTMPVPDSCWR